jgi:nitrite reductase/ring-hydroxylating ferredoxin subunit
MSILTSPGAPKVGTLLCQIETLADPGSKAFEFGEGASRFALFLIRQGADIYAYRNVCPHAGHPLDFPPDRFLTPKGDFIHCSSHGALFTPGDGVCVGGPCLGRKLMPIPIYIESGAVHIGKTP